ncbi:CAP domain-containing protein [Paracoccus pacificus]|uniref:CAP domain-containing protein n=1 Tax=Paracoccus pacificus TaxID=1463598 RepID=A0ABW4RB81_9RHOB
MSFRRIMSLALGLAVTIFALTNVAIAQGPALSRSVVLVPKGTPMPPATCEPAQLAQMTREALARTNASRRAAGLAPLVEDPRLSRVALRHACAIAEIGRLEHRGPRGLTPMKRVRAAGFNACFTAENLAAGLYDARRAVAAWQASDGHRRNMMDRRARQAGFGFVHGADGRVWWVGIYAAGCG